MSPEPSSDRDHPRQAARRIAANTIYLVAADFVGKGLAFAFFVVAARHLGAAGFGVLSTALAYVAIFAVFTDLGLGALSSREIARNPGQASELVRAALAMKLTVSLVLMVAAGISVNLLGYPPETVRVTYIASLFILTSALALYFGFVFQGLERMVFSAVFRAVQAAVLVVSAVLLTRYPPQASIYAWIYVGASAIGALTAGIILIRLSVRVGLSFRFGVWRRMLRASLPIGLAAAFAMLYYWNGTTILARVVGDEAVGFYNAPFRLVMGLGFLAHSFSGALYPVMSRLHLNEGERLQGLLSAALRYMMVLAFAIGAAGLALHRPAVLLLFGEQYGPSAPLLALLVWWGACVCLNSLLSCYFYAVNRPKVVAVQAGVSLGTNVVLNLVLIPLLGALGVAVAIVAAEVVGTVVLLARQVRTPHPLRTRVVLGTLLRVLGAGAGAGVLCWFFANRHSVSGLDAVPGLVVFIGSYGLLLLGLRAFRQEDRKVVSLLLRRETA